MNKVKRILGIDPGSIVAGFACIDIPTSQTLNPRNFNLVDMGIIKLPKEQNSVTRLQSLHQHFKTLALELDPDFCLIEKPFVGVNAHSAIKLGEARGAIITSFVNTKCEIFEITPAEVKRIITGTGQGTKEEIALGLSALLGLNLKSVKTDATDALAMAVCFAFGFRGSQKNKANRTSSFDHSTRRDKNCTIF